MKRRIGLFQFIIHTIELTGASLEITDFSEPSGRVIPSVWTKQVDELKRNSGAFRVVSHKISFVSFFSTTFVHST